MDNMLNSLNSAYDEYVNAIAEAIEASANCSDEDPPFNALESCKDRWEVLKAACDNAQAFIKSAEQSILCQSAVNVASFERAVQDLPVDDEVHEAGVTLEGDGMVMDEVNVEGGGGDKETVMEEDEGEKENVVEDAGNAAKEDAAVDAKMGNSAEEDAAAGGDKENVVEENEAVKGNEL